MENLTVIRADITPRLVTRILNGTPIFACLRIATINGDRHPFPKTKHPLRSTEFPIPLRPAPGTSLPETLPSRAPDWTCLVKGPDRAAALRALDETSPVWPDPSMVFRSGSGPAAAGWKPHLADRVVFCLSRGKPGFGRCRTPSPEIAVKRESSPGRVPEVHVPLHGGAEKPESAAERLEACFCRPIQSAPHPIRVIIGPTSLFDIVGPSRFPASGWPPVATVNGSR